MDISVQKSTGYRETGKCGTIMFTLLLIIALVLMPYRFHASSGTFGKSTVFAKGGGDDGGGDDGGASGGDDGGASGGDDGGVSGGDDGGSDHGDDAAISGDDNSGHEGGENHGMAGDSDAGSGHGDTAGDGPGASIGAGNLQGLSPVSAAEEAGLVGNWGGQSNPSRK